VLPAVNPVGWCEVSLMKDVGIDRVTWIERKDFQTGESWRLERREQADVSQDGESTTWFMTEPQELPAMAYAGDSMATSIVGIEVADIVGPADPNGSDEARYGFPQDRFTVGIEGSQFRFIFELGKPAADGQRFMRVKDLPYIFTLSDFVVSQLRQPVGRMLQDG